jgi:hypothetical protein
MNWKRFERKWSWTSLWYSSGIAFRNQGNPKKKALASLCPDQDSNQIPPKYKHYWLSQLTLQKKFDEMQIR